MVNSDAGEVNLEHVLPKTPKQGQWKGFPESERSSYLNRVGNLVLLLASENTAAGNAEFAEKRKVYEASKLALTKRVADTTCGALSRCRSGGFASLALP